MVPGSSIMTFSISSTGHTKAWGPGGGEGFLTKCPTKEGDTFGPINPTREENYKIMETLIARVRIN